MRRILNRTYKVKSLLLAVSFKNISDNKDSFNFILINIFVAFIGFVRSFAFMKFLDFNELGIMTLIQTGAMLIGFFQIGLINGGYRLLALQKSELTEETNNVIFSYFSLLSILLSVIFVLGSAIGLFSEKLIVALSVVFGLCLLINNWLTNTLIARRAYTRINKANSISVLISLASLPLAFYWGIYGGAFCLLIQPLVFSMFVLITDKNVRPTKFFINIKKIKNILHYGFIPFLSGLFFLLYMQTERWSITAFLGTTALGNLYLLFLVTTLWILVPTSILNLIFPRAVNFFENKDLSNFRSIIKMHWLVISIYCIVVSLMIIFLLSPMVVIIFPKHTPFVKYVFYAIPGLILRSLADPISVILNSVVKLKPIFWSDITSLAIYFVLISYFILTHNFSLTTAIISFNLYFAYKLIFLSISYFKLRSYINNQVGFTKFEQ